MIEEKRKNRRRDLRYNARILIAPKQFLDCKLFNVSDAGARIEVADTGVLPDRFVLVLATHGPVRRACEVAWRDPNHVGVKFVSAPATPKGDRPRRPSLRPKSRPRPNDAPNRRTPNETDGDERQWHADKKPLPPPA